MEAKVCFHIMTLSMMTYVIQGLDHSHHYECNLFKFEDDYKHINVSNPIMRKTLIGIPANKECWVNMSDLYNKFILTWKLKVLLKENSKVLISVKLACEFPITLHFQDFNVSDNSSNGLNLDLEFNKCSINLKEIDVFLTMGRIMLLSYIGNSMTTEFGTDCKFASDLQAISLQAICDDNFGQNSLFWESCKKTFPKMAALKIIGCEHSYQNLNCSSVQEKFPSLVNIVFNFVRIGQPIHFPWYVTTQTHKRDIEDILKASFESYQLIYFYNMFPEISIILINCNLKIESIFLEGIVDTFALTEMGLNFLQSRLLQNVTIRQTLDLSKNRIQIIPANLLENQHLLQELYLHQNNMTFLSKFMFSNLKHLKYINLSGNRIKYIIGTPFSALFNLEYIILHNNSLVDIPYNMFHNQINSLKVLELNSNPALTDIPLWPIYATNLNLVDLRDGNITWRSIVRLLDHLDQLDINEKLVEAAMNIQNLPFGNKANIFLSFNKIDTIPSGEMSVTRTNILKNLLTNFQIDFSGNPFTCNCDTSVIQEIVHDFNETYPLLLTTNMNGWICEKPSELRGRFIWSIKNSEKYCPIKDIFCPQYCSCFKRYQEETIIVDCRDIILENMPEHLPNSELELWFQNSNISKIEALPYLENVTVLNLANNQLQNLGPLTISKFRNLKILDLQSNHLTSLPFQMRSLTLSKVTLSDNLFVCDCTTRWMKAWILHDEGTIPDWINIKCLDINGNLKQLIAVPDSEFICKRDNSFSVTEHVFLPSIITGSVLFVLVTLSLLAYFQRFNIKVQLFIHFNIHPFDNKTDREECHVNNAVIIYTQTDHELKVKIENHLTQKGYMVADIYKNSLIGYTFIENIEQLIRKSNKIILLISTDNVHHDIIQAAWNIGYDKILSTALSRLILIADKALKKEPSIDINLSEFLTSHNFLDRNTKLLPQKVEYLMSKTKASASQTSYIEMNQCSNSNRSDICDRPNNKIVISYPDTHHSYLKNEIIPFLIDNYIPIKLLDMEFTPGADIRDQLPTILETSRHLIFIFSSETLYNEVQMYILSQALTQTQLVNHNFLIVCTSGPICLEYMTNDLSRYIENYVTISMNDPRFKQRILESIHITNYMDEEDENQVEIDPLLE